MEKEFFCVIYGDNITQYDCDEITCAAQLGRFLNDGLPPIVDIETVLQKKHLCETCNHYKSEVWMKESNRNKMSLQEIKNRLSESAAEYLMFLDD